MDICTIKGIFVEEVKNRFICKVLIGGVLIDCYVASSSRLSNYFDLIGAPVLLVSNEGNKSRTKYKLFAVQKHNCWVLVDLCFVNKCLFEYYSKEWPNLLVQREKQIEGEYKTDLLVVEESCKNVIEVKGVLCDSEEGLFPFGIGERAVRQLAFFDRILDREDYNVTYAIVVLNQYTKRIRINKGEKKFYHLFKKCVSKGMKVLLFEVILSEDNIEAREKGYLKIV